MRYSVPPRHKQAVDNLFEVLGNYNKATEMFQVPIGRPEGGWVIIPHKVLHELIWHFINEAKVTKPFKRKAR